MVGVRRGNARSDDSGYASLPKVVTIEEWLSQKDPFRVVASGFPMTWPLRKIPSPKELSKLLADLEGNILGILSHHQISFHTMRFQHWFHNFVSNEQYGEANGQDTLEISLDDTNTRAWLSATRSILTLLRENGANEVAKNLQVEINNPGKAYNDISKPLVNDPVLLKALLEIQEPVSKTVKTLFENAWSSIAYHTRVSLKSTPREEGKSTLLVYFPPETSGDFESAEDKICRILETIHIDVHLEFLVGESMLLDYVKYPNPHVIEVTEKSVNGSSVCIRGGQKKAGSLGGWVYLNLPGGHAPIPCAITCYHVVRSDDENVSTHTDEHGVIQNDQRGQEIVEYPAPIDADRTNKFLIQNLKREPDHPEFRSRFEILSKILSQPGGPSIGRVIFASGHRLEKRYRTVPEHQATTGEVVPKSRVNEHRRLDWALVQSPSTFTFNKAPSYTTFGTFKLPHGEDYIIPSKVRSFAHAKLDDWVTKRGRTTNTTSGTVNCMHREVLWSKDNITTEVEIYSPHGNFAEPGDSGSLVFNSRGEIVGMIFGTNMNGANHDVAYMLPMSRLQDDVKRMTKGGFLTLNI
ncbi:hypothetical protein FQN54_002516 [Arachnomyces sp. PD_36]|nr:hypothetical protein FQN54_002516 [Arachnomyces sp. PD_36]